jgi:hypothetical protein
MNTTSTPATEKQVAFVTRLLGERNTTGTKYEGHHTAPALTKQQASEAITALLGLPMAEQATERANEEGQQYSAGVYEQPVSGRLFRVYLGQRTGTLLVKEIIVDEDGVGYHYLGAAARHLPTTARRLSLAEVGALGKTFDHCLMCGRRLDDPESVDAGIGPVCSKKYDLGPARLVASSIPDEPEQGAFTRPEEEDADACTPGQQCTDILNLCSRHQMQYQNRYGRASNE